MVADSILMPHKQQAYDMAVRTTQRMKSGEPVVSTFLFNDTAISEHQLNVKVFDSYSVEWAEFVLMNRKNTSDSPAINLLNKTES